MLLTYYDEELHNNTLHEEGFDEGASSRDPEIIALKINLADKDAALADRDATIEELRQRLARYEDISED